MKLALSLGLMTLALAGAVPAKATPLDDAKSQIAATCRPDMKEGCGSAVCALVSSAVQWPEADQTVLGGDIASLVGELGQSNPAAADEIQGCVALGPKALVSGFQETTAANVTDTGGGVPASAQ